MRKLKTYSIFKEGISTPLDVEKDRILDKILTYSIDSLTADEREFLDSFKSGDSKEILSKQMSEFNDGIFKIQIDSIDTSNIPYKTIYCNITIIDDDYNDVYNGEIVLLDDMIEGFSFNPDSFDTVLEELNITTDFYEFIEMVSGNI